MKLNINPVAFGASAWVPANEETLDILTKTDKFGEEYKLFRWTEGQKYLEVARGLVSRAQAENDHTVVHPPVQSIAVKPPRNEDQASCIEKSYKFLSAGIDHIVEAPTGFGKTYLGCAVAGLLGQPTLIIVTKNDLVEGWHKTLVHLMGIPANQIGHIQQDKCVYKGCRFVIAMIHSLVEREYPADMYNYFGLVIFDEVHRLGSEYFENVCYKLPARHRLGLSATPTRADGRDSLFKLHIGPILVRGTWIPMSPKVLMKKTGWKVPMVNRRDPETGKWARVPMEVVPGRLGAVVKALAADVPRNTEIADMAYQSYLAGRTVLILSDLIDDHLKLLFHYITHAGVSGEHIGWYTGRQKQAELEIAKKARIVLATYAMTAEGTDVPHWDTLILATPKANVKQAVGRVLRFVDEKKQPVVFDLVDNHKMFETFYFSRLKQYYSLKAEIVEV